MTCARFHEDGGTDKALVGDAKPHLLSTACRLGLANKFSPCLDHCLALIIALSPLLPHCVVPHRLGLSGCTVTMRSAVRVVFVVGLGIPDGRGRAVWARAGTNEPEHSEGRRAPPRRVVVSGGCRPTSVYVCVRPMRTGPEAAECGRRPCAPCPGASGRAGRQHHDEPRHVWQSAEAAHQDGAYRCTHGASHLDHGALRVVDPGPQDRRDWDHRRRRSVRERGTRMYFPH